MTRRYGGGGPARRHHRHHASPARPARASAPSCRAGVTLRLYGDANDYFGKGLSGGRIVVRPRTSSPFVAEDEHHRRQRHPLRRHRRRGLHPRPGGGAVLRPQLRRHRRGRGRGRPRLRVHDRRQGRGARTDRAQLRGRHVRRHRLRLRPRAARSSAGQPRDGRRRAARRRGPRTVAATVVERHGVETGSAVGRRLLADWDAAVARVREGDAARLPAGARGDPRGRVARARRSTRRSWRRPMGKPTGFMEYRARAAAAGGPVAGAAPRLARGLRAVPATRPPRHAGGALHGLRHPVLPRRLPARQPDPGVERPRLPRRLAEADRAPARHQQLPRVHRPAVPGALRGGLRARHQRRPGHHQADRVRDHRAGLATRAGCPRSRRRCAPARRWPWSARDRPAWPPPSSWPGPGTRSRSSSGPRGPAACCATAFPSSRWRRRSSTAASPRCGPRA